MKRLHSRLTYANVIATIALFIAVGGASAFAAGQLGKNTVGAQQLKKNAVTAAKIKNGAVTGAKIKASTLATVPSATDAVNATNAVNAKNADNAKSATNAENAVNATNAKNLDGRSAGSFAPSTAEPVRIVGAPGQPAFAGTWSPAGEEQVPGFWKDPFGTVHLEGQAGRTGATGDTIFTLPPGYRPSANDYFAVYPSSGDGEASVAVLADGTVELFFLSEPSDDEFVGLTNISFRAAGS
jgi:hypothetical protein